MSRIYYLDVQKLAAEKTPCGAPKAFSISFINRDGEIREYPSAIMTSSHHRPASINIQLPEGEIRKILCRTIISFNNEEVFV